MLYWWNLPWLSITIRTFIWQKIRVWSIGHRRVWPKNHWKKSQKIAFLASFLVISSTIYKAVLYMILCLAQHYWSKFQKNSTTFGGVILKKPPRSSLKSTFLVLRKHLKIHNLVTTNAMIMKLARIMYLCETFHLAKYWHMTLRA